MSIQVRGLPEVLRRLDSVSTKVRRQLSRKSVVAAARVISTEARRNAPRKTNTLKRAIIAHYSPKRSRRDQTAVALVRVRSGRAYSNLVTKKGKRYSLDAYYAGWVEFGHKIVPRFKGKYEDYRLRGRGRLTGLANRRRAATDFGPPKHVRPHPFMAPAYRSQRERALQVMTETMRKGIEDAAR